MLDTVRSRQRHLGRFNVMQEPISCRDPQLQSSDYSGLVSRVCRTWLRGGDWLCTYTKSWLLGGSLNLQVASRDGFGMGQAIVSLACPCMSAKVKPQQAAGASYPANERTKRLKLFECQTEMLELSDGRSTLAWILCCKYVHLPLHSALTQLQHNLMSKQP